MRYRDYSRMNIIVRHVCNNSYSIDDTTKNSTLSFDIEESYKNRSDLLALLAAFEVYGSNYIYYVDSDYVYQIFTLYIYAWEANGYITKKGTTVKNKDIIRCLREKGLTAHNIKLLDVYRIINSV